MRLGIWVTGSRPRTLTAALVPVAVGSAAAVGSAPGTPWARSGLALLVAVVLQIGVNFANDYSDGVRGSDDRSRVGPLRLVGSGLVEPRLVKRAALISFGIAGLAGVVLALLSGWELLIVGALCLLAGWTYTGGPQPYGYLGLGEVFVFVFFGLVATAGTTYVLTEAIEPISLLAAVPVGLWAVGLLMANNLRDRVGDAAAEKRTLAVRLGDTTARRLYVAVVVAGYAVAVAASFGDRVMAGALLGLPFAVSALRIVTSRHPGRDLRGLLVATGRLQLASGLGLAASLATGG